MSASPNQDGGAKAVYWGGEEVQTTLKHQSSELSTSGDELLKVRKPYTITKQRERWTEEEHQKFLEALKLHGRAWRRIEEHIGTKTAVQIRSHAQKFFSKLEREQAAGGLQARTVQDIDIPPPRPKRKPSHPYPRKANVTAFDGAMASPAALPSSVSGLLVRPSVEPTIEMGKVLERCKAELKLFGQTVVVPTVTRAVAPVLEGKVHPSAEFEEASGAGTSKVLPVCVAPELLIFENKSSNKRNDTDTQKKAPVDQHQAAAAAAEADLAALYYSKVWERAAETAYPFNHGLHGANLWQFGYHRPPTTSTTPATSWPSFSAASLNEITASVMRAIMTGAPPDGGQRSDSSNSSAALAAATVAAASAWWALQGSVPPSFHGPHAAAGAPEAERQVTETEKMAVDDGVPPEGGIPPAVTRAKTSGGIPPAVTPAKSFKRQSSSSFEIQERKRVRVRCFGSSSLEKQVSEALKCYPPPPSSSGSDDGIGHPEMTERAEQLNGDGEDNSGPSSNSSHCGTAEAAAKTYESSSDKEEEAVLEEASNSVQDSTSFSHLMYRSRKVIQRVARPARSSGSDGEQRKEVSQEGRMAFQALFSHQKLPQTFSQRGGEAQSKKLGVYADFVEVYANNCYNSNRNCGDDSPNEAASSFRISGPECFDSDSSRMWSKPTTGTGDDEGQGEGESLQQPSLRDRRRSGFVPYRRAAEVAAAAAAGGFVNPIRSSCKAEENHLVKCIAASRRLIDEEVKVSSCS